MVTCISSSGSTADTPLNRSAPNSRAPYGSRSVLSVELRRAAAVVARAGPDLGVSRGLVQTSFEQLAAEGYLETQAGSATRVASSELVAAPPTPRTVMPTAPAIDFRPAARPEAASRSETVAGGEPSSADDRRRAPRLRRPAGPAGAAERDRRRTWPRDGPRAITSDVIICSGFSHGITALLEALGRARRATGSPFEDPPS